MVCCCCYCPPGHLQTSTLKAGGSVTTVTWSNLSETPTTETGCIPRGWAVTNLQVWAQVNMRYPFVTVDNFQLALLRYHLSTYLPGQRIHVTMANCFDIEGSTSGCSDWLILPPQALSIVFICCPLVPCEPLYFVGPASILPPHSTTRFILTSFISTIYSQILQSK